LALSGTAPSEINNPIKIVGYQAADRHFVAVHSTRIHPPQVRRSTPRYACGKWDSSSNRRSDAPRTAFGEMPCAGFEHTRSMWKWWGGWATVVVVLGLVTGFFPGSSPQATLDHCFVRPGDRTPGETRCTGHWSTAGFTVTGRVYGIAAGSDWQVIPPGRPDGWYEVAVPEAARNRPAVTVPAAAVGHPVLVWLIRLMLLLMVVVPVVVLVRRVRRTRRPRCRHPLLPPTGATRGRTF
jgi:hypothetical protein